MSLNGIGELLTIIGLAGLLWAEANNRQTVRAITKTLAASGFIVAAIGFGAFESSYGKTILAGLIFGAVGDVFLLGTAKRFFLGGLVAFLIGHIIYVIAFMGLPQAQSPALIAAGAVVVFMIGVARWVFPHAPDMRVPIGIYMIVIGAMVATSVGAWGAGAALIIPVGAIAFAISDIFVVRQRFVTPGFINKAIGLPLYFGAQLLIAWSIKIIG